MTKRDAYSDIEEEENESDVQRSEDEDAQDSRFSKLGTKRRKLVHSDDDDDPSDEATDNEGVADHGTELDDDEELSDGDKEDNGQQVGRQRSKPVAVAPEILTKRQLEKAQLKARKSGVIYLSRIPPFMKVHTLKAFFSPYGALGRVFLTPEPPSKYQARIKAGGNKKRSFIDGWVEFESKKKAKICAETLNGNIVGGKKGGWYHDDIWNVKYLRGFKWNDLMEHVQTEEREREGRMRAEVLKSKRERKTFLDNLDKAKVDRGMKAKRATKENLASTPGTEKLSAINSTAGSQKGKMTFRQNAVQLKDPQQAISASAMSRLF